MTDETPQMKIFPSILAADFANLERDIERIRTADGLHFDVMDAHFVPNLSFGLPVMQRVAQITELPIDAHLMMSDPDTWAVQYAKAGAASVTFHAEATNDPVALARSIRAAGAKAAIALKPNTPVNVVIESLGEYDMVLVMTVEPGFGGQSFMAEQLEKVRVIRAEAARLGLDLAIQVDGGISAATIAEAASAGADTFVAGSSVYGGGDPTERIAELRAAAGTATNL